MYVMGILFSLLDKQLHFSFLILIIISNTSLLLKKQVHELSPEKLKQREVQIIDIGNDSISSSDYKEDEDPKKFKSQKCGRGPLQGNWIETV